jgi:hypothetical protein
MRPVGQFPQFILFNLLCVASFYAVDMSTQMFDVFTKAQNLQSTPKKKVRRTKGTAMLLHYKKAKKELHVFRCRMIWLQPTFPVG